MYPIFNRRVGSGQGACGKVKSVGELSRCEIKGTDVRRGKVRVDSPFLLQAPVELPIVSAIPLNPGYRSRLVFTSARHAIGLLVPDSRASEILINYFPIFS